MADEYDETLAKARAFFDVAQSKTATWINGMPADPLDSKLALLDPLRARGVAVFETLRTYNGRLFELDAHCRRLRKSARLLGMRLPMPMGSIADALRAAAFCCGPGPLRIKVVATARDVILHVVPLVERPEIYRGVQAMFVHAERHTPRAKALPYDVSARAHARATRDGCEEALLLAPDGRVPEGAYSNLFWVKDGVLHTANNRVLLGITRGVVLRSARKQGIAVRYALALQNDLLHADEVFITKTTTGPIPIVRIGGSRIGTGKPGKTTMRIMQEFRRYYDSKLRRSSAIMRSC
jgi:branched-subunit amino acid aminotransferase/4-amino-4-deoxychorismate lyase